MTEVNKTDTVPQPLLEELQAIVKALPKMAATLPGFTDIVKFIGKLTRRAESLTARLDKLEARFPPVS